MEETKTINKQNNRWKQGQGTETNKVNKINKTNHRVHILELYIYI